MADKVILLVEDNPDDVSLTFRAFKKNNFENAAVVACDGVEALNYLFGFGEHADRDLSIMPSLVLLDIKLPLLNGFELLRKIRADERTRYLPVVMLTSSIQEEDVLEGYRLGVNSYVRKPVDFVRFTDTIRQLSVYWLTLNELPRVQMKAPN